MKEPFEVRVYISVHVFHGLCLSGAAHMFADVAVSLHAGYEMISYTTFTESGMNETAFDSHE